MKRILLFSISFLFIIFELSWAGAESISNTNINSTNQSEIIFKATMLIKNGDLMSPDGVEKASKLKLWLGF